MNWIAIVVVSLLIQDLPLKHKDEFEIKLDYQFKNRERQETSRIDFDETRAEHDAKNSSAILPYLILNVKLLKLSDQEVKVKIMNNLKDVMMTKKTSAGMNIPIDVGFTDDVKDRVTAHQYILAFFSPEKKEVSRIVIHIEEDGSFLVNGEKRGKF
jgi:hypothetical protein